MIRFQLAEQEVVQGLLKYRKPDVRPWLAVGMAVLGLVLVVRNYPPLGKEMAVAFYFGCWLVGMSVLVLALRPLLVRRAFTKVVRGNQTFTAPKEVWFDADKLTSVSPTQKTELIWTHFKKITEDGQYFYLHLDGLGNVSLLPKRAFDAESQHEFLKYSQSVSRV